MIEGRGCAKSVGCPAMASVGQLGLQGATQRRLHRTAKIAWRSDIRGAPAIKEVTVQRTRSIVLIGNLGAMFSSTHIHRPSYHVIILIRFNYEINY